MTQIAIVFMFSFVRTKVCWFVDCIAHVTNVYLEERNTRGCEAEKIVTKL